MNSLPESVEKYLKKYSINHWKLESDIRDKIVNAIVVPVISEYDNLRKLLTSLLKTNSKYFSQTVLVFVVNNLSESSDEVKNDNQNSLLFLRSVLSKHHSEDSLASALISSKMNICLIDASSNGFELPMKTGGVGLARKIGMDAALKIFNYNSSAKKILICLDADCEVDSNYLTYNR